jgi:hypothetical protein
LKDSKLFTIIKWVASITGFIGAMLIALNIPESKYAFMIFFVSSSMWIYSAHIMKEYSLIFLNVGFLTVDIIGIYRWIIM